MKPSSKLLIHNALIINEGTSAIGYVMVEGEKIAETSPGPPPEHLFDNCEVFDASGHCLIPGVIDCHVHFREPGLTHKADISSESAAAVAGGVTSFLEMPNTVPPTTTLSRWEEKNAMANGRSWANYGFFLGASADSLPEILAADPEKVCGVKVFMGTSTGHMQLGDANALEQLFKMSPLPIAAHCEDDTIIAANLEQWQHQTGGEIPVTAHSEIRSREACLRSTQLALSLARQHHTRLHITHISTADEAAILAGLDDHERQHISSETCIHYLCFSQGDYSRLGNKLKVNPSIKTDHDRESLLKALMDGNVDLLATDHAPHLESEKAQPYLQSPSGTPLVQHLLPAAIRLAHQHKIPLPALIEKLCHAPAKCYRIKGRGYIRRGFYADLTLLDLNKSWTVDKTNVRYKCGWSVFEGETFGSSVLMTIVNGQVAFRNGALAGTAQGRQLTYDRLVRQQPKTS